MLGLSGLTGLLLFLVGLSMHSSSEATPDYNREKDPAFWHKTANDELRSSLKAVPIMGRAKNIILFIGDGMGPTTVTAGRILAGQMKGLKGEEYRLSFDKFPVTGLAVTYDVDKQVTDSAAAATAYTSGVKTNHGILGLNAKATKGQCASGKGAEVSSILRWSKDAGKSAGVVTTTTVTHATPASTYAHTVNRDWEVDTDMPQEAKQAGCKDIALQLVEQNNDIEVVMGGGMNNFKPSGYTYPHPDDNPWYKKQTRGRTDSRDLTQEWQEMKKKANVRYRFVANKTEFDSVDPSNTDYLLGIFAEFHMAYEMERDKLWEPSLADMTEKAIKMLQKNDKGYFLMVEGGRIDHGHHESLPAKALHEVVTFSDAVAKAVDLTKDSDTLILVTADHSHTMSIAGYSSRGNPILAKNDVADNENIKDGMPYTTLLYANGPGYNATRQNLTFVNTTDKDYVSQSAVPTYWETHGGEDVAMYARGPQSFLYSGVHENVYIPMLMAYASCVGPYKEESDCAPALKANDSPAVAVSFPATQLLVTGLSVLASRILLGH